MKSLRHLAFGLGILLPALALSPSQADAGLRISEKTKYYTITGSSASELARSMSKRGPFSFQHRRRAWATASRDLTFQLVRKKSRSGCSVKDARLKLSITYTMPRLSTGQRLKKSVRRNWQRIFALLDKHEKTHGRFYKEFARKAERTLKRLRPARSCRQLERDAMAAIKRLSAEDSARNDRFDARDQRNYSRMALLLRR